MDRSAYIVSLDLIILISGPVTVERLTVPGSQSGEHLTSFMFTGQTISCQALFSPSNAIFLSQRLL